MHDIRPESPAARCAAPTDGWLLGGRYRVLDRIGRGGMAEVFRAHDELLERAVALKVFRTLGAPDTALGPERQKAELYALAQLNHPNLITLYDGSIVDQDGPAYLVMELIDGPNLAQRIAGGAVDEAEVAEVGRQVADALAYVHAAGMVHRDVKPANILLGTDGAGEGDALRVRLSDFGIVRLLGTEGMTSADFTLGTASYLAPEQASGSDVGPAADVYALGLTLIEALTGLRSFEGEPLEAAMARLARDPVVPPGLADPLSSLLPAMTARDPEARPSAVRVAQLLRDGDAITAPIMGLAPEPTTAALETPIFTSTPVFTSTPIDPATLSPDGAGLDPRRPDSARPRRRRWGWLLAGVTVLAALAVGAVLLFESMTPGKSSTTPQHPAGTHKAAPGTGPARHRSSGPASEGSAPGSAPASASRAHHATGTRAATSPAGGHRKSTSAAAPSTSAAPNSSAAPSPSAPVTPSAPATTADASSSGSEPTGTPAG